MRRLGYIEDTRDDRDLPAGQLLGVARALPDAVSLRGHVGEVLDQGGLSSCVAHAIAKGLQILWSVGGETSPPLISRLGLYYQARAFHAAQHLDDGTYPRLAFKALRDYGFGLEAFYPYDEARVNLAPPPALYQHSFDEAETCAYYRCSDVSVERVTQVWQALASLKPVCLGIKVDRAFLDDPGPTWRYAGPSLGGHCVAACGASAEGLLIVNSWGAGWGDAGFTTISWDTIGDASVCTDVYVLDVAPKPSEDTHAS